MTKQDNLNAFMRELQRRQSDYDLKDIVEARAKLVETWRAAHPEAVLEASPALHPMMQIDPGRQPDNINHPEIWANDTYQATVRRWTQDKVFGSSGGMVQIGINTLNGTARHDWREFQAIKNQLAGPECEGFELYPAESRLLDPSNYYTLWCFPGLKQIKVGANEGRRVFDADEALSPQRALPKEE